jgi:hypothetical protein
MTSSYFKAGVTGDALRADILKALLEDCVPSALIDRDVTSLVSMIVARHLLEKGWQRGHD